MRTRAERAFPIKENSCKRQRKKEAYMAAPYNHSAIEKKWRENWEKNPNNVNDGKKPK